MDFYSAPQNQDVTGLRVPATVISLNRQYEGIIEVRWRSRLIQVGISDIIRAIV